MIHQMIDHTLLKATATTKDIETLCNEAMKYQFKSVCVMPCFVDYAKKVLKGSDVLVCTVIGFPLGASTMEVKWQETIDAINNGADEIDMVMNIGKAKECDASYIREEIEGVVGAASGRIVKVILETCYLTDEEKKMACECAVLAKADFVKTSTGFGTAGATLEDVRLMRSVVPQTMGVKASGGVRSLDDVMAFIEAGANRIGASSGVAIMNQQTSKEDY